MSQILISYGTSYGHTEKVVRRMSQVLQNHGHSVMPTGPIGFLRKSESAPTMPASWPARLSAGSISVICWTSCGSMPAS